MKFMVIGSGGREHALAWRLLTDGSAREVFVVPGNGGIAPEYCVRMDITRHQDIIAFCRDRKIDFVVIGPEAPLAAGLADALLAAGIPHFGPSAKAAMLEGSKLFAKNVMEKSGVPTARHHEFTGKKSLVAHLEALQQFPVVIKLDGLAAGKGVIVAETREDALLFVEENVTEATLVFVEDYLSGEEASVLGICDGKTVLPFIAAQDHKRVFDGDLGPNTGGMGAYAPAPVADATAVADYCTRVHQPVVDTMRSMGIPFKGILYAGLMIGGRMDVLEFNARFGDPEAQVLLPLIDGKLGDIMIAAYEERLQPGMLKFSSCSAMTVVMASAGYPGPYEKGRAISGLDLVSDELIVFHAGTVREDNRTFTAGGRVLAVTAVASTIEAARDMIYGEIEKIRFEGAHYRKDIGHRAFARNR